MDGNTGMDDTATEELFFTDKQLRERWKCSHMKLWRLRKRGLLRPIKVGGIGPNLTPSSEVKAAEAPATEAA
jgi:hypothetical protein